MRVLVFGAGATGSLLGALLARAGVGVDLVARPAHVEAIRAHGLSVDGLDGGPFRIPVSDRVEPGAVYDRILFTVKAGDIEEGAAQIARGLAHPAPLLALQNGLGIRPRTVRAVRSAGWAFAETWVVRGIQMLGATLVGPGAIRRAGPGEAVVLGTSGIVGGLAGFDLLLGRAGVSARVVPDIDREEWRKAILNAAMNPVTADHGVENGRLLEDPFRGQSLALLEEARQVAEAEGYPFPRDAMEAELFRLARSSASNRSSMLQDLDAGRPTEIDAISGEVLRRGASHGLDLPNTRRAVERIFARARAVDRAGAGRGSAGRGRPAPAGAGSDAKPR